MPYLRFTICTFPVVVGSAFLLLDRVSGVEASSDTSLDEPPSTIARSATLSAWLRRGAMVALVALLMFLRYGEAQRGMRGIVSDTGSRIVVAGARMLSRTLEPDAVIISQSPFYCYIGTRESFRHYDLPRFNSPFNSPERRQPKRTERLRKFYASLDEVGKIRKKRELILAFLDQGRQVVFFIPQNALEREKGQLGDSFKFMLLKEWDAPFSSPPAKWGVYQVERNINFLLTR